MHARAAGGGFLGLDETGARELATRLVAVAEEVDRLAARASSAVDGLDLDVGAAGPVALILPRMAADDRRAAKVLLAAQRRLTGHDLGSLLAAARSWFDLRNAQAAIVCVPWSRWAPASPFPVLSGLGWPAPEWHGGGVFVVDGDGRADRITVGIDGDDVVVVVDDREVRVPRSAAGIVVVRAGAGHDVVRVADGADVPVLVLGGEGDDDIRLGSRRDVVLAGPGDDYVDAGPGADTVLAGPGDDAVYGMAGADRLLGGRGGDHLDGARGSDLLWGGAGLDVLAGGEGRDRPVRVEADHVVDGGAAGPGAPGWSIAVEGDDAFVARVQADIVTLNGTASGSALLSAIDAAFRASRRDGRFGPLHLGASDGNRVEVVETEEERGSVWSHSDRLAPGPSGTDATVELNPGFHARHPPGGDRIEAGPPLVVLFHELVHAWNHQTGTEAPGTYEGPGPDGPVAGKEDVAAMERQAVGLPIDHDRDPSTPDAAAAGHPVELTENALRAELGLAARAVYRVASDRPATGSTPSGGTEPGAAGHGARRRHRRPHHAR